MKKISWYTKVLLLTVLFVLVIMNICFADVYISPEEESRAQLEAITGEVASIFIVISAILGIFFLCVLVCMISAKIYKAEELFRRCKNISENLCYYMLVIFGFGFAMLWMWSLSYLYDESLLLRGLPLIDIYISLFLRLKNKNKKASYIILGIYVIPMALLVYSESNI